MASGSSGRPNSGFDFASDDILCSYDDFSNSQDSANGTHSDPSIGANPSKDFQKSRISRSSVFPSANAYAQPEESLSQEVISTVERTMKKYSDNLMRFLEGISSRLSQLELYCYNLDKSIGEMRSDLVRDHGETDSKLKFLEKHLQEVHRSVQILRDKQELAETQKELAKLQLAQKESSSPSQDERTAVSASEPKKSDDVSDAPNTQLALALPSQIAQQPSHPAAQQPSSQTHSQMQSYYLPPNQLPNPQAQNHPSYLAADAPYRAPQASQPSQSQVNQTPQTQQFPQYQQQWPQQVSQPMQLPQQPPVQPQQPPPMQPPQQPPMPPPQQQSMQAPQQPPMQPPQQPMQPPQQPQNQIRPPTPQSSVYPPYMTNQSANHSPPEGMSSSMSMQMPMPYGYGGASRPVPPQPSPPHMKGGFPSQQGDGYATGGSHQQISSAGSYMLYDGEGGRPHHPSQQPHYSQGSYPPTNPSLPNMPPPGSGGVMIRSPGPQQYVRNHPYNELIDKLVSMGYRGDHVVNVIQRLEESGQAVDFNAVLDRLNGHSSGSSQRSW